MESKHCNPPSDFNKRFRVVFLLLEIGGLSINRESISRLRHIYNVIATFLIYAFYAGIFMASIAYKDDLEIVMVTVRGLLPVGNILWTRECFRLSDSFTWEELPTRDPITGHLTMAGVIPRIQIIIKYVFIITATFHCVQSTVRMLTVRATMMNTWYPFVNMSVSPAFEIINVMQILPSLCVISMFCGNMLLYATLVAIPCSQLEKIRANLLKIKQKLQSIEHDTYAETKDNTIIEIHNFQQFQEELNECIRQHQVIIRYMDSLEDIFSLIICGQFLILLITLCLVAFSAITSWGNPTEVSQALLAYLLLMGNIYITCTFGNELTRQAEEVREAAYGCDWIDAPISFQKCIYFIMSMANKEFTLTAGKFVPVSNTTLMHMMNQTLSFFMFLLQVKEMKDGIDQI